MTWLLPPAAARARGTRFQLPPGRASTPVSPPGGAGGRAGCGLLGKRPGAEGKALRWAGQTWQAGHWPLAWESEDGFTPTGREEAGECTGAQAEHQGSGRATFCLSGFGSGSGRSRAGVDSQKQLCPPPALRTAPHLALLETLLLNVYTLINRLINVREEGRGRGREKHP